MLKFLTAEQVNAIVKAAIALNKKYPPSEMGVAGSDITTDDIMAYDADEKPLVALISSLSKDTRIELMALMWFGRGDFDNFDEAVEYARENSDEADAHYIAEKSPALPEYLTRGISKIG